MVALPRFSTLSLILIVTFGIIAAGIIAATAVLTPIQTSPAFATAEAFVDAAVTGDDDAAMAYLSQELRIYVAANCPGGSVSACIDSYIPDNWGAYRDITFRRATPADQAWDVDLIGYWEQDQGFSGVCVYARMAQEADGVWRVQRWAGFAWCGDASTRDMETNPSAPNAAP